MRVRGVCPTSLLLGCLSLSSFVGCTSALQEEPRWTLAELDALGLDSAHAPLCEALLSKARHRHRLELFLRHDNRTEQTALPLVYQITRAGQVIAQDTLDIKLAKAPGHWLGGELLSSEVSLQGSLAPTVYTPTAGIYQLRFYAPDTLSIAPKGFTALGFRLIPLESRTR